MSETNTKFNSANVLERGIDVLLAIKNTSIATTTEIHTQVMPQVSKRCVQRYLKSLVEVGLIYSRSDAGLESRYYLSGKAKQLFGV